MSRKSFEPKDCISALNNIKKGFDLRDIPFSKETLLDCFKNIGLPCNSDFFTAFHQDKLITKVGPNQYKFTCKEPIPYTTLEYVKKTYQAKRNKYKKPKEVKKVEIEEVKPEILPITEKKSDVQLAIELLKSKGYVILAPAGVIYDII